jgi:hypothetical protein
LSPEALKETIAHSLTPLGARKNPEKRRTFSVVGGYLSGMPAPFGATWGTLRDRCEELPADSTLITPLATKRFRITDVRQSQIIIEDTDTGDTQPLQREQFATLAEHVSDSTTPDTASEFEIERLPAEAEPYAAVLAIHPDTSSTSRRERSPNSPKPTRALSLTMHHTSPRRPTPTNPTSARSRRFRSIRICCC